METNLFIKGMQVGDLGAGSCLAAISIDNLFRGSHQRTSVST